MKKRVLINTNQRIDNPDFQNLIDFNANEFENIVKYLISEAESSKKGRVLSGFDFSVSSGITLETALENLAIITSNGDFASRLSSEPKLTIALADDSTNYIEAQVYTENTESQTKAFFNPLTLTEYTQTVNTVKEKKIRLTVNQSGFTDNADSVPVCVAVTASGSVERIHDNYKNEVLTGSPTNPTFKESKLFSLNDDDNDGNSEDFDFGSPRTDQNINTLEDFVKANLTQIKNIIGDGNSTGSVETDWFTEPATDLFSANQDRNIILTGEDISFNNTTDNVTYSENLVFHIPNTDGKNIIQTSGSPISISNNQTAYVTLDRDASTDQNLTVTVVNSDSVPEGKDIFILCHRISDSEVLLWNGVILKSNNEVATYVFQNGGVSTLSSNLVIRGSSADPKLILRANDDTSTQWEVYLDNSEDDELVFAAPGVSDYGAKITKDADLEIFRSSVVKLRFSPLEYSSTRPDTIHRDMFVWARAQTNSSGVINGGGVNLSCSNPGNGRFVYTFDEPMADDDYSVLISLNDNTTENIENYEYIDVTTTGFEVRFYDGSFTLTDPHEHSVIVVGQQY